MKTFEFPQKSLWNPDNKDMLCGWQCLAVGLYSSKSPKIKEKKKARRNAPRDKLAKFLRDLYYKNSPENPHDQIALDDWPEICKTFDRDIRIYTIQTNTKLLYPEFDHPNERTGKLGIHELGADDGGKTIRIHYEPNLKTGKGHYCLITSYKGYNRNSMVCQICNQKFESAGRYDNHMNKHYKETTPHQQKLQFVDQEIEYKESAYEKHFGPLEHAIFLAFDFECLLVEMDQTLDIKKKVNEERQLRPTKLRRLSKPKEKDETKETNDERLLRPTKLRRLSKPKELKEPIVKEGRFVQQGGCQNQMTEKKKRVTKQKNQKKERKDKKNGGEVYTRRHEPYGVVLKSFGGKKEWDLRYHGEGAEVKLVERLTKIHGEVFHAKVKIFYEQNVTKIHELENRESENEKHTDIGRTTKITSQTKNVLSSTL
jgi:hypothetical protein